MQVCRPYSCPFVRPYTDSQRCFRYVLPGLPKGQAVTKCLVYVTFVLEIIDTVLLTYGAFRVFGYGFGDFGALTSIQFDFLSVPVAGGIDTGRCLGAGRIIIATCMTYYLSRNTTEFPPTRVVISKLIRLIVQTGSLTGTGGAVAYYTAGGYIIPKLYANCILVSSSYSVGGSVDHGPASARERVFSGFREYQRHDDVMEMKAYGAQPASCRTAHRNMTIQ
ncbi:hypothetical protein B0H17DRAFT_1099917 [Mycena rosella]|uniref:DUF6534 domain-containing protein n=1 Tax=Mycena rosella TaxID=1033263 RepID=A0AAD7CN47_MYCRO|nr:hypothetical protein B0H17DRAFT_1099917 [Mycena rosella]